jgi:hypothetical protein
MFLQKTRQQLPSGKCSIKGQGYQMANVKGVLIVGHLDQKGF